VQCGPFRLGGLLDLLNLSLVLRDGLPIELLGSLQHLQVVLLQGALTHLLSFRHPLLKDSQVVVQPLLDRMDTLECRRLLLFPGQANLACTGEFGAAILGRHKRERGQ